MTKGYEEQKKWFTIKQALLVPGTASICIIFLGKRGLADGKEGKGGGKHEYRIKMDWKHHQTVDHPKREPQVGRDCLVSIYLFYLVQISIFQIHQIFSISYFPQFNLSFEKKHLFPKMPKNHSNI